MKKNNIFNYMKGFTLIELLAIIAVLGIIITIIIVVVRNITDNVDENIDEITKNMIISAANEYTLEYRETANWKEEKKSDGASFCVSLASLIDKGYFENNNSSFEKYRNKYAVSGNIVSGVYKYQLVKLDRILEDNICEYVKKNSTLMENDPETGEYVEVEKIIKNTSIENGEKELGSFKYDVTMVNNMYRMNTNLDVKIKEFMKNNSNIFVNILLDESRSMSADYNNAVATIIDFSKTLSDVGIKHSFIGFGDYPKLRRDYSIDALQNLDFIYNGIFEKDTPGLEEWAFATNSHAALDLVTSLVYNSKQDKLINNDSKIYTIMFTDGNPYERLWMVDDDNQEYDVKEMGEDKGYDLTKNDLAEKYYSKYKDSVYDCSPPADKNFEEIVNATGKFECKKDEYSIIFDNEINYKRAWKYLEASSKFLKSVGSKMIVAAYKYDFASSAINVVSADDICVNSSKEGYCYYFSTNTEEIKKMFSNFSNIFTEMVLVNKVKLTIAPIIDSNGVPLVKIYNEKEQEIGEFEEIVLSENIPEQLKISNNFSFVINEDSDLFDVKNMNCSNDRNNCTYEGTKQLFDIKLSLYKDGSWSDITIVQPEFNLSLSRISTIN